MKLIICIYSELNIFIFMSDIVMCVCIHVGIYTLKPYQTKKSKRNQLVLMDRYFKKEDKILRVHPLTAIVIGTIE